MNHDGPFFTPFPRHQIFKGIALLIGLLLLSAAPPSKDSYDFLNDPRLSKTAGKVTKPIEFDLAKIINVPGLKLGVPYWEAEKALSDAGVKFERANYPWDDGWEAYSFTRGITGIGLPGSLTSDVRLNIDLQVLQGSFITSGRYTSFEDGWKVVEQIRDALEESNGLLRFYLDLQTGGGYMWTGENPPEALAVALHAQGIGAGAVRKGMSLTLTYMRANGPPPTGDYKPKRPMHQDLSALLGVGGLKRGVPFDEFAKALKSAGIRASQTTVRTKGLDLENKLLAFSKAVRFTGLKGGVPHQVTAKSSGGKTQMLETIEIVVPGGEASAEAAAAVCDAERKALTDEFGAPVYNEKSAVSERYSWGEWQKSGDTVVRLTRIGGPHPACLLIFQ